MKKLLRITKSGREIYGPKWEHTNEFDEIESDDDIPSSPVESAETTDQISRTEAGNMTIETNIVQPSPPEVNRIGRRSDRQSAMYKAALEGDWLAAEMLLERDPALLCDGITERGDRALHVAVAKKHTEFVRKLVVRMSPNDLKLLDGHGYTAFCYAAIAGAVNIAEVMMRKNPILSTERDKNGETPIRKAASHGNAETVSYLLGFAKLEDLSDDEWFDLLLVAIRREMFDVALKILQKNASVATMKNEEGTALHRLAQQDISEGGNFVKTMVWQSIYGTGFPLKEKTGKESERKMRPELRSLAEKLWEEIQRWEEASVLELMRNPPILHAAAKVGNVELIDMLTRTCPDLLWETDCNGHTMFHIAVMYRQEDVFRLIHQIGVMKDLILISQDKNGNNILHLAGELPHPDAMKTVPLSALQMQREMTWFMRLKDAVPPSCLEMKNREELRPRELFSARHERLLRKSQAWMKSTADSCMLIATIILTVVFAAAFTSPGGYDQKTGIPLLLKSGWFTCFVIFEAMALLGSTLSILMFWSIMASSFQEYEFEWWLPIRLKLGLTGLLVSLIGATSAFMSAYFLVFVQERAALVIPVILLVYIMLFAVNYGLLSMLWAQTTLPDYVRPARMPFSR